MSGEKKRGRGRRRFVASRADIEAAFDVHDNVARRSSREASLLLGCCHDIANRRRQELGIKAAPGPSGGALSAAEKIDLVVRSAPLLREGKPVAEVAIALGTSGRALANAWRERAGMAPSHWDCGSLSLRVGAVKPLSLTGLRRVCLPLSDVTPGVQEVAQEQIVTTGDRAEMAVLGTTPTHLICCPTGIRWEPQQ